MRRNLIIGLIVVVLLGSGFVLMNYFAGKKTLPPERKPLESINYVKTEKVIYQDIPTEVVAYGRVASSQPVDLIAEVSGKLLPGQVVMKEGEKFKQGQLICRVYDVEARLNLQARKSQFLNLIASILPDIKVDFNENFAAWQQYFEKIDIESELPELPEAMNIKEKTFLATKNILSEYYSIQSLQENLRKYKIYAPYNGSIVTVNSELGSVVNPGANIARIIRTDRLELVIPVEVEDIKWVQQGAEVMIDSEENESEWTGRVIRKADYVDPNTQSINVYIAINNVNGSELYDGQYLRAIIPGEQVFSAMEIPRRIMVNEHQLYVLEDSTLKIKDINVHKVNQENIIISGLEEGTQIVVEAPTNAAENMKVQVLNENI